ncbi:Retinal homeobox protein Rx1 [Vanrija pseudolonga]|uniref:Retinal homeobox protein Rx1 n=1 Tax=Vanrija pseudolonga TaxID=143232 RepID=A0AAF0YCY0_9TREE|nr:Retinal homeobox protein Rx1 [Vanrija pseudolonga]
MIVQVGDSGLGGARRHADAAEPTPPDGSGPSSMPTPRAKNTSSSRRRVTAAQLEQLVAAFTNNEYPTTHERDALASRLAMPSRSVQIWASGLCTPTGVDAHTLSVPESPAVAPCAGADCAPAVTD